MTKSLESISTAASDLLEAGDPERALPLYLEAVSMAAAAGKQSELSSLLGDLAVAYRRVGDIQAAIETNRRAIDVARSCGDDLNVARWSGNLGGILYSQGDTDGAESCFREAMEAAARTGTTEQMAIAAGHLAGMLGERHRFSDAVETMARAREYAAASPTVTSVIREQECGLFVRWARTLSDEGRLRETREVIDRALASAPGAPPTRDVVFLLMLLADISEREGDIVSASEAIERAASASQAIGDHDEARQVRDLARRMRG